MQFPSPGWTLRPRKGSSLAGLLPGALALQVFAWSSRGRSTFPKKRARAPGEPADTPPNPRTLGANNW